MIEVDYSPAGDAAAFQKASDGATRPVVIRGAAADWPLVAAGQSSPKDAANHIASFDNGRPTQVMAAQPQARGRFFYTADMAGFNFERGKARISDLLNHLIGALDQPEAPAIYAGATSIADHLPGLDAANMFPLAQAIRDAVPRIWIGNATQVAAHFDVSDNFAVVGVGTRRFTLFPPAATPDLYVGPLNVTLAGQPVSMVDPLAPNFDRYPRYATAAEQADSVLLGPGDAISIPAM